MEKINIAVRKLVEILLEDTEFVIERLPKSTMFGKTEEEIREHIYPIFKKYYDFTVREDDIKHLPFEASRVSRPTNKDLKLNLNILLSSRIVLLVWLQCTTLPE